jgi:hypothetical protein
LQALLKLEDHAVAHSEAMATTSRLARLFRSDVHRAEDCELGGGGGGLDRVILSGPGSRRVRYLLDRGRLVRVEEHTGEVRTSDAFRIPMATARFEATDGVGFELVTLVFDRRVTRRKRGDAREVRIDAALGRDWRFAKEGGP